MKGIRICPQSTAFFEEVFKHSSLPDGTEEISLVGGDQQPPISCTSELALLSQGYVTITPLSFDLTERPLLARLKKWSWARRFKDFLNKR
jgi:5'-nucleotidase